MCRLWLPSWLSLCFVSLVGCGTSLADKEMRYARAAEARGDVVGAATHWSNACKANWREKEACQRATQMGDQLRDESVRAAKQPCEQGDIETCVARLQAIRGLRPKDEAVRALLSNVATAHRTRCAKREVAGRLETVLERLTCVEEKASVVADAVYETIVVEERDHAALLFSQEAAITPGARYALHATSYCLSPRFVSASQIQGSASELVSAAAQTIGLRAKTVNNASLQALPTCVSVAAELGPRAKCNPNETPNAPSLIADLSLGVEPTVHKVTEEVLIARYLSHVQRDANPAYPPAERRARIAEQAVIQSERRMLRAKSECEVDRSPKQTACDRYQVERRTLSRYEDEKSEAARALQQTPAIFETPVYAEVPYRLRHHTWLTSYQLKVELMSGATETVTSAVTFRDDEHAAVPRANVALDALETPTKADVESQIRAAAQTLTTKLLSTSFAAFATCAASPWRWEAEPLECKMRSALYLGRSVPAPKTWLQRTCAP